MSSGRLDRDEQRIFNAFSRIEVDVNSLAKVEQSMECKKIKRPMGFSMAAVVIAILIAVSGTAYATSGRLGDFLSRFNPNFGEFAIAPLEAAYTIDEGIRIEVVGAQQIGNVVLVYVSMQDISGENRLTRHHMPDMEIYVDGRMMSGGSTRRLSFDSSTNSSYFEMIIFGEAGMPRMYALELVANSILCLRHSGQLQRLTEGYWRVIASTSDMGIEPITWMSVWAGDIYIEYMSLTPFGLQLSGRGEVDPASVWHETEVELRNRRRNIRFTGGGGGFAPDEFNAFWHVSSPIDLDAVEAVIFNGERILINPQQ